MITSTTTSAFPPDPREAALTRARAMFPAAPIGDVIAVAEYLLRPVPVAAPVYATGGWVPPYQVTCSTAAPDVVPAMLGRGEYLVSPKVARRFLDHNSAEPMIRLVADALAIDPAKLRRPDDDGTAGVLAKVG